MRDAIIYNKNNPSIIFYESGNTGITEAQMVQMKGIRDQYDPFGGRAIGCREMVAARMPNMAVRCFTLTRAQRSRCG